MRDSLRVQHVRGRRPCMHSSGTLHAFKPAPSAGAAHWRRSARRRLGAPLLASILQRPLQRKDNAPQAARVVAHLDAAWVSVVGHDVAFECHDVRERGRDAPRSRHLLGQLTGDVHNDLLRVDIAVVVARRPGKLEVDLAQVNLLHILATEEGLAVALVGLGLCRLLRVAARSQHGPLLVVVGRARQPEKPPLLLGLKRVVRVGDGEATGVALRVLRGELRPQLVNLPLQLALGRGLHRCTPLAALLLAARVLRRGLTRSNPLALRDKVLQLCCRQSG
mmetsp:Transcript_19942/g.53762  ORF Transcript_19942/g.53762 Transcript_19942/m.53762 type:complete len:278 (-) Transcript_19942:656-1489(-)